MQEFTEKTTARRRRVAQGGTETSGRVNCGLSVQVNGVVIPASMCMLPSGELVSINIAHQTHHVENYTFLKPKITQKETT